MVLVFRESVIFSYNKMGRLRHENRALRQGNVASLVSLTASDDATTITSTGLLKGGLDASRISSAWIISNAGGVPGAGIGLTAGGTVVSQFGGKLSAILFCSLDGTSWQQSWIDWPP